MVQQPQWPHAPCQQDYPSHQQGRDAAPVRSLIPRSRSKKTKNLQAPPPPPHPLSQEDLNFFREIHVENECKNLQAPPPKNEINKALRTIIWTVTFWQVKASLMYERHFLSEEWVEIIFVSPSKCGGETKGSKWHLTNVRHKALFWWITWQP